MWLIIVLSRRDVARRTAATISLRRDRRRFFIFFFCCRYSVKLVINLQFFWIKFFGLAENFDPRRGSSSDSARYPRSVSGVLRLIESVDGRGARHGVTQPSYESRSALIGEARTSLKYMIATRLARRRSRCNTSSGPARSSPSGRDERRKRTTAGPTTSRRTPE